MNITPNCASCHYGHPTTYGGRQCRINPPIANPAATHEDKYSQRIWPMVQDHEWCGKWDWQGNYA